MIDTPEMFKIITWWKDLADKGYFIYSGTPDAYTPEGLMFVSKRTAIHLSTSAGISNVFSFAPQLGKFTPRVAPFPIPDANARTASLRAGQRSG